MARPHLPRPRALPPRRGRRRDQRRLTSERRRPRAHLHPRDGGSDRQPSCSRRPGQRRTSAIGTRSHGALGASGTSNSPAPPMPKPNVNALAAPALRIMPPMGSALSKMDEIHEEEHHAHLACIKAKLLCSQQGQGDHPDGVVDEHEEIRRHRGDLAQNALGLLLGLASSRAVRPVRATAACIRANNEPASRTPETTVDNQNTARQPSSAVRYPPLRSPALPPAPVERLKAVMAAPPPGRARNTESNPAVASSATPTPWMPRAGSSVVCEAASAASTEPSKSAADPATAVHFGPTRSTSHAAGRLVTSRPAKKTEKTSPAPVALSASDSWIGWQRRRHDVHAPVREE